MCEHRLRRWGPQRFHASTVFRTDQPPAHQNRSPSSMDAGHATHCTKTGPNCGHPAVVGLPPCRPKQREQTGLHPPQAPPGSAPLSSAARQSPQDWSQTAPAPSATECTSPPARTGPPSDSIDAPPMPPAEGNQTSPNPYATPCSPPPASPAPNPLSSHAHEITTDSAA
jgi:hypothetical protein